MPAAHDAYAHGGGELGFKTVTTVSSQIFAADENRRYLFLFNSHATAWIFITLNNVGNPAELQKGIAIGPRSFYEISAVNQYRGAIHAIADRVDIAVLIGLGYQYGR